VALLMVCLSLAWSEPLFRSRAALSMMLLLRGARKDQQHFSTDVEKYRGRCSSEKKQGFEITFVDRNQKDESFCAKVVLIIDSIDCEGGPPRPKTRRRE
jgi:hypothetical protein